ncbi:MAG TPA: hypothetical protein VJ937_11045, partial [Salinivirga sp.]|uniref:hypothetical protein n=1 Tax=Salinivirga sp. TaxID=1970192 RepID=UPI002B46801C
TGGITSGYGGWLSWCETSLIPPESRKGFYRLVEAFNFLGKFIACQPGRRDHERLVGLGLWETSLIPPESRKGFYRKVEAFIFM